MTIFARGSVPSDIFFNFGDTALTQNMKNISFICDNKVLEKYLTIDSMAKIKDNLHFIDYNINKLPQIIKNNIIENEDVKPLYISNYF